MSHEQNKKTREEIILEHIIENPGITKTRVIEHMKRKSALVTTLDIIKKLIETGKVNMKRDQNNSQVHHLFANDNNQFNKICQTLAEIDSIVHAMNRPMNQINQEFMDERHRHQRTNELTELRQRFQVPYKESVKLMLEILLSQTMEMIRSESDCQIIYKKIIKLTQKLNQQYWILEDLKDRLHVLNGLLRQLIHLPEIQAYSRKKHVDIDPAYELMMYLSNFEERFVHSS